MPKGSGLLRVRHFWASQSFSYRSELTYAPLFSLLLLSFSLAFLVSSSSGSGSGSSSLITSLVRFLFGLKLSLRGSLSSSSSSSSPKHSGECFNEQYQKVLSPAAKCMLGVLMTIVTWDHNPASVHIMIRCTMPCIYSIACHSNTLI